MWAIDGPERTVTEMGIIIFVEGNLEVGHVFDRAFGILGGVPGVRAFGHSAPVLGIRDFVAFELRADDDAIAVKLDAIRAISAVRQCVAARRAAPVKLGEEQEVLCGCFDGDALQRLQADPQVLLLAPVNPATYLLDAEAEDLRRRQERYPCKPGEWVMLLLPVWMLTAARSENGGGIGFAYRISWAVLDFP